MTYYAAGIVLTSLSICSLVRSKQIRLNPASLVEV